MISAIFNQALFPHFAHRKSRSAIDAFASGSPRCVSRIGCCLLKSTSACLNVWLGRLVFRVNCKSSSHDRLVHRCIPSSEGYRASLCCSLDFEIISLLAESSQPRYAIRRQAIATSLDLVEAKRPRFRRVWSIWSYVKVCLTTSA